MEYRFKLVVLIAPNVSEQMGGEGIKALQICREVSRLHPGVVQITHARNRRSLDKVAGLPEVLFVEDTALMRLLWRSVVFRFLIDTLFSLQAIRLAERVVRERGLERHEAVFHQTEPNSPVIRRFLSRLHVNVFGPINGNIYYPRAFRSNESASARLRRMLHFPLQALNRLLPGGIKRADLILCAGGERTRSSLLAGGCFPQQLVDTIDCGIPDELLSRERIVHRGENRRFVHFGRLVYHKCTALIIESLAHSKVGCQLDIIGRGPELERCKRIAAQFGVQERVRFLDWFPTHEALLSKLGEYRGMPFPSIEDANGIVVQEAMAIGLPVIALDWGGPQLLVEHGQTGFLIDAGSRAGIVESLARWMDTLAIDGTKAESISVAGRVRAEGWRWTRAARQWLALYDRVPLTRR